MTNGSGGSASALNRDVAPSEAAPDASTDRRAELPDGRRTQSALSAAWIVARPILGWICIALGLLGVLLPIFPGLPFLVPGIALVGRRTWAIRWASVTCKRLVRRMAARSGTPLVGQLGRWALRAQHEFSRRRRRLAWRRMELQRARQLAPLDE